MKTFLSSLCGFSSHPPSESSSPHSNHLRYHSSLPDIYLPSCEQKPISANVFKFKNLRKTRSYFEIKTNPFTSSNVVHPQSIKDYSSTNSNNLSISNNIINTNDDDLNPKRYWKEITKKQILKDKCMNLEQTKKVFEFRNMVNNTKLNRIKQEMQNKDNQIQLLLNDHKRNNENSVKEIEQLRKVKCKLEKDNQLLMKTNCEVKEMERRCKKIEIELGKERIQRENAEKMLSDNNRKVDVIRKEKEDEKKKLNGIIKELEKELNDVKQEKKKLEGVVEEVKKKEKEGKGNDGSCCGSDGGSVGETVATLDGKKEDGIGNSKINNNNDNKIVNKEENVVKNDLISNKEQNVKSNNNNTNSVNVSKTGVNDNNNGKSSNPFNVPTTTQTQQQTAVQEQPKQQTSIIQQQSTIQPQQQQSTIQPQQQNPLPQSLPFTNPSQPILPSQNPLPQTQPQLPIIQTENNSLYTKANPFLTSSYFKSSSQSNQPSLSQNIPSGPFTVPKNLQQQQQPPQQSLPFYNQSSTNIFQTQQPSQMNNNTNYYNSMQVDQHQMPSSSSSNMPFTLPSNPFTMTNNTINTTTNTVNTIAMGGGFNNNGLGFSMMNNTNANKNNPFLPQKKNQVKSSTSLFD